MKKYLLILAPLMFSGLKLCAQKLEVSVQANTGLFHFAGNSSTATTQVLQGSITGDPMNRANNPYGNENALSYGGGLQVQTISKGGFIVGLQGGYELLRSKVEVDKYSPITTVLYGDYLPIAANDPSFTVTGHVAFQSQSINLNPYIGYRFQLSKVNLDILPGMDIGLILNSKDKGEVKDKDGKIYKVDYKRSKAPTDIRLRLGAAASYGRYGLNASFAHGISNYMKDMVGDASFNTHSEYFRLGLSYRLL
ncbi:outer membrane beta-barrel protein [Mucilaginibacter rubeus]|uniref:PorT family protein n=1 Tax=Mucilaginibacter rubeus TaxID=2027860 RepID=A0A5C1I3H4_9SPHI|nr:outer membrane beta-barrel protein [Mucilaginibacter rubeus]QEM11870.1 PorT family protein [Mucilaginibacter rubeus]